MHTSRCCVDDAHSQERAHRVVTFHRVATSSGFVYALLVKVVVIWGDLVGDITLCEDRANSRLNNLNLRAC